ncbi:aminotransferase [Denitrobaculum tricleocarpae]|uniref:aspartate transaminase n=2 Tax=Denitrobaculum tricleocarpae TaxID=2591009 RepID=A0A545SY37_9PROT|nr:aminotransferase [Denitrobaculum tricleocarpae]
MPPIPAVQESAQNYDGHHGPLIDLSQAVPGYPAHPLLLTHLQESARQPELLGYGKIEGEPTLRDAYAADLRQVYHADVSDAEVHITSGCNQAFVASALTVAGPGEKLLLVTPFYFNHESTLSMLGIGTKAVAAKAEDGFLPDPDLVKAAVTPDIRALVCVTPNNPTGAVYPPDLMDVLFDICVERGIWLIVDETYRDFLPGNAAQPHRLFQRPNWRNHLIGLYSFSKSFCIPGHRLGAVTAGRDIVMQIAKVMDNLQICAPRPPQCAVAKAMPQLGDWRDSNRAEIARRRDSLEKVVSGLSNWQIASIGAYFSYIRHPFEGSASVDVAARLAAERGVLCLPGAFFGEGQDAFLRLAFANAGCSELEELSVRLA